MSQAKTHKEYNTFVRGLITEASPLTFPENAAVSLDNLILNVDGSLQIRQGMDYEDSYVKSSNISVTEFEENVITAIEWRNVDNNGLYNFLVIQIGSTLYIHDMGETAIDESIGEIDLDTFKSPYVNSTANEEVEGYVVNGQLVIVSKNIEPFYISYEIESSTFAATEIVIKIRDFIGVEDNIEPVESSAPINRVRVKCFSYAGYVVFEGKAKVGATITNESGDTGRVTSRYFEKQVGDYYYWVVFLDNVVGSWNVGDWVVDITCTIDTSVTVGTTIATDEYLYNLYNAGWSDININSYKTSTGNYPDKTQIWWHGKDTSDNFTPTLLVKQYFGNSLAPKGHFIIDAFTRNREAVSGLTGLDIPNNYERNRPSTVTFWAGRAFYSGIESNPAFPSSKELYNGYIFFSKIIQSNNDFDKCYQEADPTAEVISDIIDTDGGTIVIGDAATILKLIPLEQELVVIATNGVWSIEGVEDKGFTPSNYNVRIISSIGGINKKSIVSVENSIFYWTDNGIHVLSPDQVSGRLSPTDITQSTIRTFYSSISSEAKRTAKGKYDPISKVVKWIYNGNTGYSSSNYRNKYNKELNLNLQLGAFFPHTIQELDSYSPYIADLFNTPNIVNLTVTNTVIDSSYTTVVVNGETVAVTQDVSGEGSTSTKYLAIEPQIDGLNSQYTFARYKNNDFLDWETSDSIGKGYTAEIITGYELLGDTSRFKQAPYITTHFERTETEWIDDGAGNAVFNDPSSCYMQSRWDFSDHSNSGKWGNPQQVYRMKRVLFPATLPEIFNYGHSVITTKNRIRGSGRALSIRFYSEANNNMKLLGWGTEYEGRTDT